MRATLLFEDRLTVIPPDGAGPLKFRVPTEITPPTTVEGARVMLTSVGGTIVSVAVLVEPPTEPVIVTFDCVDTALVEIVKTDEVAPSAMWTEVGATALEELELRATSIPPVGAAPFNVNVPVTSVPPTTEVGDSTSDAPTGGFTVKVAVVVEMSAVAEIERVTGCAVGTVEMLNVAVVEPAATVTVAGVEAIEFPEESITTFPPAGAAVPSVTVPVA